MCELLEYLLRISPSGQNPCRSNKCKLFQEHCSLWGGGGGNGAVGILQIWLFYWVWRFVIHLLIKPSEWPHQYRSSPYNYEFKFQPHPGLSSSRACWPLTFALGWRENLRFFKQIICWAPRILQVQSTGLPSIFLKALTPTKKTWGLCICSGPVKWNCCAFCFPVLKGMLRNPYNCGNK